MRLTGLLLTTLSFCWTFSSTTFAKEAMCEGGSLSCLHEAVGTGCGLGTCLPTGKTLGGDFSCECKSAGTPGGDTRCAHGSLSCMGRNIGDACGLGTCMDTDGGPFGYSCECQGGDIFPPSSHPEPEPAPVPKKSWRFCDPNDPDTGFCSEKAAMALYSEGNDLLALFCARPGEIRSIIEMDGRRTGLKNLFATLKVDGEKIQTVSATESPSEEDIALYVGGVLNSAALDALKAGSEVQVSVATGAKTLGRIDLSLHGSAAAIRSLERICR